MAQWMIVLVTSLTTLSSLLQTRMMGERNRVLYNWFSVHCGICIHTNKCMLSEKKIKQILMIEKVRQQQNKHKQLYKMYRRKRLEAMLSDGNHSYF